MSCAAWVLRHLLALALSLVSIADVMDTVLYVPVTVSHTLSVQGLPSLHQQITLVCKIWDDWHCIFGRRHPKYAFNWLCAVGVSGSLYCSAVPAETAWACIAEQLVPALLALHTPFDVHKPFCTSQVHEGIKPFM